MRVHSSIIATIVLAIGLLASACGSNPALHLPLLERKDLQLRGGKGVVLSVREPAAVAEVQQLVDANRSGLALVRVFTYGPTGQPGKDQPAALYEWTVVDGLQRRY